MSFLCLLNIVLFLLFDHLSVVAVLAVDVVVVVVVVVFVVVVVVFVVVVVWWQKQGHTLHIVPRNYNLNIGLTDLISEKIR